MQTIAWQAVLIFACGLAGGFTNCLLRGPRHFWFRHDSEGNWHPGWFGCILLGGFAALVTWGIYGPGASYDVMGTDASALRLTLAQLCTSVLVGIGGSHVLTLEAQKIILRHQRDLEEQAKETTATATKIILEELPDEPNEDGPEQTDRPPDA